MAASKEYSPEQLNYFRICYVTTDIIAPGLRTVFKDQWDTRYRGTSDEWKDTAQNGVDFYNMESTKSKEKNDKNLAIVKIGNTLEWDCTRLFFAILHSVAIGKELDSGVKEAVKDLRLFRNEVFAHLSSGKLTEHKFQTSMDTVKNAFATLNLDTADIEEVRNQNTFPIEELRVTQELLEKEKMRKEKPEAFCVLPPKPSNEVSYREKETKNILQEMEKLRNTKPNEITVIYLSGSPGCGKSEVARQVGEKVFDEIPNKETEVKFVFTLNASSIDRLIESYVEFAVSLKCDENSTTNIGTSTDLSQEDKLILLKSLVAPKLRKYSSWLLIVDNVTDLKSVFRYLLEAGEKTDGKGQILVTTQDKRSIADDSYTYHISLSRGMNLDEAMGTLLVISDMAADDEVTTQVAKTLDLQPLALACAATYMKCVRKTTPSFSWQLYLQNLEQGKREATEGEYKKISRAYTQTMTAAVKLAIEREVAEDAVMLRAFKFLSAMAPEAIPLEYIVQYVTRSMPDEDKELVAANVTSSSLILSFEGQSQEICVHQVVHACLNTILRQQSMDEIEELHFLLNVIQAFSTLLLNSFDENNFNDIMATKSLVVHFVHFSSQLNLCLKNPDLKLKIKFGEEDNGLSKCLLSTGHICKIHGKYEEARNLFEISLMIGENIYGKDHPALASTLNVLGNSLQHLGKQKEAIKYFKRALTIQERFLDPNDPGLVSTLNNLGGSLGKLGQHEEAKTCFERALTIQKDFGRTPRAMASTLNNLGLTLGDLGQYKQAKACLEEALVLEESVFDSNSPALASTLNNLGNILDYLGQYKEAKSNFEKALAIEEKVFRSNHPALASTLNNLGNSLSKHKEAKALFLRALEIEERELGPDHPDLASTLNNLGNTLGDLGEHEQAKALFLRALEIEERELGPNHSEVASTLSNLGNTLGDLGEHEQAKACFLRALEIEERELDPNHPDLASTLSNLGNTLGDLGEHEQAKARF